MAADRKISRIENQRIRDIGARDKLIVFENHEIAISYWGLATIDSKPMENHLNSVRSSMLEAEQPVNVDTFAQNLMSYLQRYVPSSRMGFHISGYIDGVPRIRHVFHADWHAPSGFTNENSNVESHDNEGTKVPHTTTEDYIPHISLFNGDNVVIQNLLLTIPAFKGLNYALDYQTLTLLETMELAKLLISTTIYLQKFLRGYRRIGSTCGNGLDIVEITPSGICWVARNLEAVNINVV